MKVGHVWKKSRANKFFSFEKSYLNRSWKQSWSVSSSFPSFSSSCDSSLLLPSFAIGEPQNNLSFAQLGLDENEILFFEMQHNNDKRSFSLLDLATFPLDWKVCFHFYKKIFYFFFGHSFLMKIPKQNSQPLHLTSNILKCGSFSLNLSLKDTMKSLWRRDSLIFIS